jgi:hypothetical protein
MTVELHGLPARALDAYLLDQPAGEAEPGGETKNERRGHLSRLGRSAAAGGIGVDRDPRGMADGTTVLQPGVDAQAEGAARGANGAAQPLVAGTDPLTGRSEGCGKVDIAALRPLFHSHYGDGYDC